MRRILLTLVLLLSGVMAWAQPNWANPSVNNYPQSTPVYISLQVDGNAYALDPQAPAPISRYIVAAFVNGECRAVDDAGTETQGVFYYTLNVRGTNDEVTSQPTITFKVYDKTEGLTYSPTEQATFDGESHGYPSNLFNVNLASITSIKEITPITISVGQTVNLMDYLSIVPPQATAPDVTWTYTVNDASQYFTLDGNQITGVAPTPDGNALPYTLGVHASLGGNYEYDLEVVVYDKIGIEYLQGLSANDVLEIPRGTTLSTFLAGKFQVTPANAPDVSVTYETQATDIISVANDGSDGTAIAVGQTYITVRPTADPSVSVMFTLKVIVPVTGISANPTAITVNVGENAYNAIRDIITISPNDATYDKKDLYFEQGDMVQAPAYDVINQTGVAIANGVVTVHVSDEQGSNYTVDVTVTVVTPLTDISKQSATITVNRGATDVWAQILTGCALAPVPAEASYGDFTYTPTDPTIVNAGGTALAAGQTTVTISSTNYPAITTTVTVTVEVPVESLTVTINEQKPVRYQDFTVTVTPTPADATINTENLAVAFTNGNNPGGWVLATYTPNQQGLVEGAVTLTVKANVIGDLGISATYGKAIDVANTTIGGDYSFKTGWQWMSVYQDDNTLETTGMSEYNTAAYFNSKLLDMRSDVGLLYNDPQYGLFGDINTINANKMYMVKVTGNVAFGMVGGSRPNTVAPINKGWNWMVYPYQYDETLADVAAAFNNAQDGDMIVSKSDGFAEYSNGQWEGNLKSLKYAEGYLYYCANDDTQINWPDEVDLPQTLPASPAKGRDQQASHWQYDPSRFMSNMSMIATVEELNDPDRYTIGAFVGDECRGEGVAVNGRYFITVHADAKEEVSFKLYDQETGNEIPLNETFGFQQRKGTLKAPVSFTYDVLATGISTLGQDVPGAAIYDLNGRRVSEMTHGVYVVRMMENGKLVSKKVMKH